MSRKFNQQFACSRMMLPEHCGNLQQHAAAKARCEEQRKPLADEQLQAEKQQILEQALHDHKNLLFTLLTDSGRSSLSGVPYKLDENAGTIFIDTGNEKKVIIKASAVIGLSFEL